MKDLKPEKKPGKGWAGCPNSVVVFFLHIADKRIVFRGKKKFYKPEQNSRSTVCLRIVIAVVHELFGNLNIKSQPGQAAPGLLLNLPNGAQGRQTRGC